MKIFYYFIIAGSAGKAQIETCPPAKKVAVLGKIYKIHSYHNTIDSV